MSTCDTEAEHIDARANIAAPQPADRATTARRMCPNHAPRATVGPSVGSAGSTTPTASTLVAAPRLATPLAPPPIRELIEATPEPPAPLHPHRRRTIGVTIAAVIVLVAAAREMWPALSGHHGLRQIGLLWLVPAVLLAAASMLAAALLQRCVLRAAGLEVHATSMMAITVAGNAMSVTLPLAGSTAGTAFTYHQLKRHGADLAIAGWTLAMSGIVSTSALGVVLGVGATLAGSGTTAVLGPITIAVGVLPMAALVASFRWPAVRTTIDRAVTRLIRSFQRVTHRGLQLDPAIVSTTFDRVAGFRLGWRAAGTTAALSVVNWTTDMLCLAVCVRALGAPVPWTHLAVVYAAALGAASLSFTPAGLGIVEGAVALALVRSGTPADLAVVAALMYRAVSCWLVLAVGWVTYAAMRSPRAATAAIRAGRASLAPPQPAPR